MIEQGRETPALPSIRRKGRVSPLEEENGFFRVIATRKTQELLGSSVAGEQEQSLRLRKTSALPKTEGRLSPGAGDRVRSERGCWWNAPRPAQDPRPARAELGVGFGPPVAAAHPHLP